MLEPTKDLRTRWGALFTVPFAAFLFDRLFYEAELGLNLLLFAMVVVGILVLERGRANLSLPARVVLLGTLLSAAMVVVHGSVLARMSVLIGLVLGSALAQEPRMRSLFYAAQRWVHNVLNAPTSAWDTLGTLLRGRKGERTRSGWGRIVVLPVLVAIVFFQMYRVGNPRFDALTAGFLDGLWNVLGDLLAEIFTAHTIFFLFALLSCAALLRSHVHPLVLQWEQRWTDHLLRIRVRRPHWLAPLSMNALERERRMGVVLLVIVNLLLLVVNIIDINWVWFGFTVPADFSLKQFVHEGTWALIWSILLSMVVILHLFRGNQNFFVRNRDLKRLALLWVAQNFILGVSVFLRNYHYISFHGLAYKRIGVIVFLALVLVGLVTLYIKVRERRSFFYLVRVNAWAMFVVMVGASCVDWDSSIVRFNLRHDNPGEIDIDNYLAMSDKVLPLIYANFDKVEAQMARHRTNRVRWVEHLDPEEFRAALDRKRERFLFRVEEQDWRSWTWADHRTHAALKQAGLAAADQHPTGPATMAEVGHPCTTSAVDMR